MTMVIRNIKLKRIFKVNINKIKQTKILNTYIKFDFIYQVQIPNQIDVNVLQVDPANSKIESNFYTPSTSDQIYYDTNSFETTITTNSTACMNLEINNDLLTKKCQNSHNYHHQQQMFSYYSESTNKNLNSNSNSANFSTSQPTQYSHINNENINGNNKFYSDMNNNMQCSIPNQAFIENIQENVFPIDSNMYQYNSSYLNGSAGSMENYCYYNAATLDENSLVVNNSQFNDYTFNHVFNYQN